MLEETINLISYNKNFLLNFFFLNAMEESMKRVPATRSDKILCSLSWIRGYFPACSEIGGWHRRLLQGMGGSEIWPLGSTSPEFHQLDLLLYFIKLSQIRLFKFT